MPIKKINGAASIDEIEEQVIKETKQSVNLKKKTVRVVIMVLAALVVIFISIDLFITQKSHSLAGTASIYGNVVNKQLTPVPARIFILKDDVETSANSQGDFLLAGLPAGEFKGIGVGQGMGQEIPVSLMAGERQFIGRVMVEETQLPPGE
jgi:hypothetical protein